MCIELIRQFYDLPRQFRITGQLGIEQFVSYSNSGIKPQYQGMIGDTDLGMRLPVFDIKVIPQKKNSYETEPETSWRCSFISWASLPRGRRIRRWRA